MVQFIAALVEAAVIRWQSVEVAVAVWIRALEPMATGDEHALVGRDGGTVGLLFEQESRGLSEGFVEFG